MKIIREPGKLQVRFGRRETKFIDIERSGLEIEILTGVDENNGTETTVIKILTTATCETQVFHVSDRKKVITINDRTYFDSRYRIKREEAGF